MKPIDTKRFEPDPNAPIPSIHERRSYVTDKDLTNDQIGAAEEAATKIEIPLQNVIMKIDTLNDEIASLSYLSNEAWRLAFKAGENPGTDEHAFFLAPVMRRICHLSNEVAGLLSGIGASSESGEWRWQ